MTIGLILLGILAVLIFFGVTERFFRRIGIANWIAFLLVLALVIGAVIPNIRFGGFTVNISGFLIPVALSVLFAILIGWDGELARAMIAMVGVVAVTVAVRMLIVPDSPGMRVTSSLIIGFVGGTVAYLIGMSRLATLFAAMSGIAAGDIVSSLLNRFLLTGTPVALGSRGIFDAIIIASVFGIVLYEAIGAMRRAMNRTRVSNASLNIESAEDADLADIPAEEDESYRDYFEDDAEA